MATQGKDRLPRWLCYPDRASTAQKAQDQGHRTPRFEHSDNGGAEGSYFGKTAKHSRTFLAFTHSAPTPGLHCDNSSIYMVWCRSDLRPYLESLIMLHGRQPPAYRPAIFMFWLMAIMTQLNLNHLFNNIIGTGWFVTLGLVLSSVFLILVVRIPFRQALGLPGYLIISTLTSYLVIGMSVAFITDVSWNLDYMVPFRIGTAALIVVGTALGATMALRRVGVEQVLKGILIILTVNCISILMSPLLIEYIYIVIPERHWQIASGRFTGFSRSPNIAGIFACQTVVLALCLLNGGRYRMFASLAAILGSAAVVTTFSRMAIIILVLIFLFFMWSSISDTHRKRRSSGTWLLIAFVGTILIFSGFSLEHFRVREDMLERLMSITPLLTDTDRYDPRFEIWTVAWSQITESPLFGHGIPQFHLLEGAAHLCATGDKVCSAHNSYLLLWGEAGIVPLWLFLIFIGSLFSKRLTLPRWISMDAVAGWILVFALDSMVMDGTLYSTWHAFLIGLSCALVAQAMRESSGQRAGRTLRARPVSGGATTPGVHFP